MNPRRITSTLLGTAFGCALALGASDGRAECPEAKQNVTLAQASGSGVNSPATGAAPKTDIAPGGTTGEEKQQGAERTSKSSGTGNPLAGDEMGKPRPDANPRSGEDAIDAGEPRGPRGVD